MTTESDVDPDVSGIVDRLNDIRHTTGHRLPRVFQDWMVLAVAAFERDEETYADRLDRYATLDEDRETRAEVARTFSQALGELVLATTEAQRPVVGDVYEQIGAQADDFGQFFTPWPVCEAKAELIIGGDDLREATPEDPLTVADPACGSARLLIAAAKAVHGMDPDAPVLVSGTDKDRTCARMAVVNLVIAEVPGRIRYGNSLTMEIRREWRVEPSRSGPAVRQVNPDDLPDGPGDVEGETDADDDTDADAQPSVADAAAAQVNLAEFGSGGEP